jgi:hypothetical protein
MCEEIVDVVNEQDEVIGRAPQERISQEIVSGPKKLIRDLILDPLDFRIVFHHFRNLDFVIRIHWSVCSR